MKNILPVIIVVALAFWEAKAFLSRQQRSCSKHFGVLSQQQSSSPSYYALVLSADKSRDQEIPSTSQRTHYSSRSRRTKNLDRSKFESLLKGRSAAKINEWMQTQANNGTTDMPLDQWTSHEEADFIRTLRDHKAYKAINIFTKHLSRKNVFVYTAAIASLATTDGHKRAALQLLDEMELNNVRPSPYTFSALFQAAASPNQALALQERLKREYPAVVWMPPVWESAIYACSQKPGNWTIAQHFMSEMQQQGISPTARTYLALFQVCSTTCNVSHALAILRDLLQPGSPVAVTPRIWGAALQVCSIVGDYKASRSILTLMQENGHTANVRHCTSYLKALASSKQDYAAVEMLDYMIESQTNKTCVSPWSGLSVDPPDMIALQAVLTACASTENYTQSRRLLERIKNGDFGDVQVDVQCYNLVLAACRDPAEAKALVREMRLTRRHRVGVVPPSLITYTRAITVCRKAADMDSALFFLNRSRDDAIVPDVYLYSATIWTAARAGDCDAAFRILEEMKDNGCAPNVVTYNGIISSLQTCGRAEDAVAVFEEVTANHLTPTLTTYLQLAGALRKVPAVDDKIELLERVLEVVGTRRIEIEGPIIESLITAHATTGNYKEAKRVFDSIQGPPDTACLRAVLLACSKAIPPEWEDAESLLHDNTAPNSTADPDSLCKAMLACSKANEWEISLGLLRRYGNNETSVVAFNSLIAACGRSHRADMAISLLNDMEDSYSISPDNLSYRNAIIACNQAEHSKKSQNETGLFEWWECAVSLLRRMQESGLRPDIQTFSSAISACEAAGQWQRAISVLQSMLDTEEATDGEGPVLNQYCFNAAISACEKGGAWVEALEIYERMKDIESLQPTMVTLSSLVQALDKAGQKEIAQSYYKEGLAKKIVNPWRYTRNEQGEKVRAMDLHKFSAAMTRAVVRRHFETLLNGKQPTTISDLILIVGKGLHSTSEEPVLLPTVRRLLQREFGIHATLSASNRGRLIVNATTLSAFVATKSWR